MDSGTKRKDLVKAQKIGNVFRFIDALAALNDGGEFENALLEIYSEELELKKENTSPIQAAFLVWILKFRMKD